MSPALSSVANHFQVSLSLASWVMTAYMVSGAVMTVIMGRLSDLVGAKKMLMLMMMCFAVGTILAPFSRDVYTLFAIRALQGIAVASTPISTKVIRDQFPKGKFAVGMGIYLSSYSGGMALGGVLGPSIAAGAGWQGLFYFTAPIAVILTFVCWRFIHTDETKKIHEHGDTVIDKHLLDSRHRDFPTKAQKQPKRQRLDFMGIITMTVTLVSLLIAITFSGSIATNFTSFVVPSSRRNYFSNNFYNCGKASKGSFNKPEVSFPSSYFYWEHYDADVWYSTIFHYYWHTSIGLSTSSLWIRTRPNSYWTITASIWLVNDDLRSGLRTINRKEKGTKYKTTRTWHSNFSHFILVTYTIPLNITSC